MEKAVLVVGGGISGMTVAVEAAECGKKVYLVEKEAYLGGRVSRMNKYFPKLCPPYCGMEINFRRIRANKNITVLTSSEVTEVSGSEGDYNATVTTAPMMVNQKCVCCDDCTAVCTESRDDKFNYDLSKTKAISLPHPMAFPMRYTIDPGSCKTESCAKCVEVCKYNAIELNAKESSQTLEVESVVYATGWKPFDAGKIENLGYTDVTNVITNVEMERFASTVGPTAGKILRRDNGAPAKKVVFVQCAGSRDENYLPYCSSICCLVSIKQAKYVRDLYPEDSEVYIFYIDLRAPGKYETFYKSLQEDTKVNFIKGKVAKIEQGGDGSAVVTAEDILGGGKVVIECDLVVLATGMEPSLSNGNTPNWLKVDDNGFVQSANGMIAAGVAAAPVDVTTSIKSSTGAALHAIQKGIGK